jgi:succinoglycan biosynthesis transport protein ExoP
MANEPVLTLSDYLAIARSRAPYLLGISFGVLIISVIVAFSITPTYRATGTIMVESQEAPENNAPASRLQDQVNLISERVMTRDNLLEIAHKYNIATEYVVHLTDAQLLDKMKSRIDVEVVNPSNSSSQGPRANSFTLSFEDRNPQVALDVTNKLIALFLDWNIKLRTQGAQETTNFLSEETSKLKAEVDRREKLITSFKQQNKNALPEQLTLRMTMLSRAENDLREVERDYRGTQEEISSLEIELAAAKQGSGVDTHSQTSQPQTLPELKAELSRLSAVYSDEYPDIKILKRKIEKMERTSGTLASGVSVPDASDPIMYKIQAKISADNLRLKSLEEQKETLQKTIAENEGAMIQTPKVEQSLDELIRERDSAQKKYEEILNKKMNAQIAQSMESENMSEHFSLLEPPLLPEKPVKPNRLKIILFGFILALFSSGGTVMALESIEKRVRGTELLSSVLGARPLVVIPYIIVQAEEDRRKKLWKTGISAAAILFVLMLVAVNYLYMPLNTLFIKVLAKLM